MTKVNNRIAEKATGLASNCLTVLPIISLALDTVFNTLIPLPSAPPPSVFTLSSQCGGTAGFSLSVSQ